MVLQIWARSYSAQSRSVPGRGGPDQEVDKSGFRVYVQAVDWCGYIVPPGRRSR